MKKLASVLLALALLLSLSVAVFAEETTPMISVTDENRTYEVYQIFTGDLYNGVLSNIKWGKNGTGTTGTAVSDTVLSELKDANADGKTLADKLTVIEKYVSLDSENKYGEVSKSNPLTNIPAGYYLLKDVSAQTGGQERSEYVVQVVGPVTVTAKAGEIVPDKQVKDTNDSTGTTSDWQDVADYDIGDDVPFKLSATITSKYDNYGSYYLCFHDTLSDGLKFNKNSVVVKVDGTTISANYTVKTDALGDSCSFHVEFTDLKKITSVKANSVITVEYTAELTTDAVIGAAGNSNKMHLEYSNDPNSTDDADRGNTPDQEVKVFTYKLIINKKDDKGQALTGAGFTLYKKIKGENNAADTWKQIGDEVKGDNLTTFTWTGLDDGAYKLVETTTPSGYNTMEDIYFTIASTKENATDNPLKLVALTSTYTNTDPENGKTGTFGTTNVTDGFITADIVNYAGTVLPETGASGTTLFLIFGSMLTLAAVVFLTVRKKMSIYED